MPLGKGMTCFRLLAGVIFFASAAHVRSIQGEKHSIADSFGIPLQTAAPPAAEGKSMNVPKLIGVDLHFAATESKRFDLHEVASSLGGAEIAAVERPVADRTKALPDFNRLNGRTVLECVSAHCPYTVGKRDCCQSAAVKESGFTDFNQIFREYNILQRVTIFHCGPANSMQILSQNKVFDLTVGKRKISNFPDAVRADHLFDL